MSFRDKLVGGVRLRLSSLRFATTSRRFFTTLLCLHCAFDAPLWRLRACKPRIPADTRNGQSHRRSNCNARRLRRTGGRVPHGGRDATVPRLQTRLWERGRAGDGCGSVNGSPPPSSLAGPAALHGLVRTIPSRPSPGPARRGASPWSALGVPIAAWPAGP